MRNTNATIEESMQRVEQIQNIGDCYGKEIVIYISMAFGNPYGDVYDPAIVEHWVDRLHEMGINSISISDTIGIATPEVITELYQVLYADFPAVEFGSHFHTTPETWKGKVDAAYENGCKRFDGAIRGFGGCPMASDDLTGNMPTERLVEYFDDAGKDHGLDMDAFNAAMIVAATVFQQ